MKTININLYTYQELDKKAQEKALSQWRKTGDNLFWLPSMLNDECNELIRKYKMKCTSNHPVCMYSLSSCQGDGVMFEGTFEWQGYTVTVKHSGHYYHSNSKEVTIVDSEGIDAPNAKYTLFEAIYHTICEKLEKYGYDTIEEEESEEHFIDICNNEEMFFEVDGTTRNITV